MKSKRRHRSSLSGVPHVKRKSKRRHRSSLTGVPLVKRKKPWPLGERPPWWPLPPNERWPTVWEVTVRYPSKAVGNGFLALIFGTLVILFIEAVMNMILSVFTASYLDGALVVLLIVAWPAVVVAIWWASMYGMIRGRWILAGAD